MAGASGDCQTMNMRLLAWRWRRRKARIYGQRQSQRPAFLRSQAGVGAKPWVSHGRRLIWSVERRRSQTRRRDAASDHLSTAACEVLRGIPRTGALVFPATRGDGPMAGFPKFWARIAKLGELPADVTPHVLRHSFASIAGDLGYSDSTIAALIGHKGQSITSRYVHAADAVLLAAADKIAERIVYLMRGA